MANIRVDLGYEVYDGAEVVFRTPCDCSDITGLRVYYTKSNGALSSKVFTLKDAHNNNVGSLSDLFASGVLIKVLLDVTKGYAYILNADTNKYLEENFGNANHMKNILKASPLILVEGRDYGKTFPDNPVKGQLFFIEV